MTAAILLLNHRYLWAILRQWTYRNSGLPTTPVMGLFRWLLPYAAPSRDRRYLENLWCTGHSMDSPCCSTCHGDLLRHSDRGWRSRFKADTWQEQSRLAHRNVSLLCTALTSDTCCDGRSVKTTRTTGHG